MYISISIYIYIYIYIFVVDTHTCGCHVRNIGHINVYTCMYADMCICKSFNFEIATVYDTYIYTLYMYK